jgi:hypothetical protein
MAQEPETTLVDWLIARQRIPIALILQAGTVE